METGRDAAQLLELIANASAGDVVDVPEDLSVLGMRASKLIRLIADAHERGARIKAGRYSLGPVCAILARADHDVLSVAIQAGHSRPGAKTPGRKPSLTPEQIEALHEAKVAGRSMEELEQMSGLKRAQIYVVLAKYRESLKADRHEDSVED